MFDGKAFGVEIVSAVKAHMEKTVAPLLAQMAELRAEIDTLKAMPAPKDGKDADQDAVAEAVASIITGNMRKDFEELRAAVDTISVHDDIPAMIAQAIAPIEQKSADLDTLIKAEVTIQMADKRMKDHEEAMEARENDKATMADLIAAEVAKLPHAVDGNDGEPGKDGADGKDADIGLITDMVTSAVAALPPAENGKDADPELIRLMVAEAVSAVPPAKDGADGKDIDPDVVKATIVEHVEATLAGWERPQDGKSVTAEELRPLIEESAQRAVAAIPVPKDGKDGADVVDLLIDREGALVATLSNGKTKTLGPVVGKDGSAGADGKDGTPGKDGKDVDIAEIDRAIAEKVATIVPPEVERDAYLAAFAPDDVAANISLAVKTMAETPKTIQAQHRSDAQPINVSVTMPEMKASDTTVNVSLPEQPPPTITVEPSVVNVAPANVHVETRRGKEVTKVTGWDKNGRITSFEKSEVDE